MMHNTELTTSNIGDVWMRLDLTERGQFAATNRIYRQRFFQLNPTISFSLGIRNINYEYKSHFSAFDATTENVTTDNILQWNYRTIQTPIQIKIKPLTSKKLSFIAGGYLGYNYHCSESNLSSGIQIPHDNMKNKLDKGIILGMDYDWFKKGDLLIGNSLSYYRGYPYLHPFKYTRRSQGLTIGFTAKWGL